MCVKPLLFPLQLNNKTFLYQDTHICIIKCCTAQTFHHLHYCLAASGKTQNNSRNQAVGSIGWKKVTGSECSVLEL